MDYQISLYHCAECGVQINEKDVFEDEYEGNLCRHCKSPVTHAGYRPANWVSVALYDVGRAYGGPEEGGWWYDVGSRIDETIRCFEEGDTPQVALYEELLLKRWKSYGGRRGDNRYEVRIYREQLAPAGFPSRKPIYC